MQAQILLTLSATSLKSLVDAGEIPLEEIPSFAMREFDLRGLNVPASMFAGRPIETFDVLRDNADKAGCPVLILVEENPLKFGFETDEERDATLERIGRLSIAANRLGCNSLAVCCECPPDDEDAFELTADGLKEAISRVEGLDLNLLIAPCEGMTDDPDRLTDLIKRVGGFRIGSFPSFSHAVSSKDPKETLRKLAPYAGGIEATVRMGKGGAVNVDAIEAVESILSVGYLNTMAIRFEGKGDPVQAVTSARRQLAETLGQLDEEDLEEVLEALEQAANAEALAGEGGTASDALADDSDSQDQVEFEPLPDEDAEELNEDEEEQD